MAAERRLFPKEFHTRKAAGTLLDDFGLNLTYENYLIPEKPVNVSEISVALSPALDILEEAKYEQTHLKTKSALPPLPPSESGKIDSVTGKIEELGLAVRMKSEEMGSLRRLSSYLDSQKVLITHKIQQLKGKKDSEDRSSLPPEVCVPENPPIPTE